MALPNPPPPAPIASRHARYLGCEAESRASSIKLLDGTASRQTQAALTSLLLNRSLGDWKHARFSVGDKSMASASIIVAIVATWFKTVLSLELPNRQLWLACATACGDDALYRRMLPLPRQAGTM